MKSNTLSFCVAWLVTGLLGTIIVNYGLDDVNAAYWLLGIMLFPIGLLLWLIINRCVTRSSSKYAAIIAGIILYWPILIGASALLLGVRTIIYSE